LCMSDPRAFAKMRAANDGSGFAAASEAAARELHDERHRTGCTAARDERTALCVVAREQQPCAAARQTVALARHPHAERRSAVAFGKRERVAHAHERRAIARGLHAHDVSVLAVYDAAREAIRLRVLERRARDREHRLERPFGAGAAMFAERELEEDPELPLCRAIVLAHDEFAAARGATPMHGARLVARAVWTRAGVFIVSAAFARSEIFELRIAALLDRQAAQRDGGGMDERLVAARRDDAATRRDTERETAAQHDVIEHATSAHARRPAQAQHVATPRAFDERGEYRLLRFAEPLDELDAVPRQHAALELVADLDRFADRGERQDRTSHTDAAHLHARQYPGDDERGGQEPRHAPEQAHTAVVCDAGRRHEPAAEQPAHAHVAETAAERFGIDLHGAPVTPSRAPARRRCRARRARAARPWRRRFPAAARCDGRAPAGRCA